MGSKDQCQMLLHKLISHTVVQVIMRRIMHWENRKICKEHISQYIMQMSLLSSKELKENYLCSNLALKTELQGSLFNKLSAN